jgi:1-acyl-sn-glycerol-3-phosphate acyltransferase
MTAGQSEPKTMQRVVIDEPYEFVPPVYSDWWPNILRFYLPRYLRKAYGVHSVECRHVERLRASLTAGHSIILAPNHSKMADPLVLGMLALKAGCYLFAMASWHAFKQNRLQTFMIRRMGAFSVLREGNDRQAIDTAIDILLARKRPLILFPEGAVTRHNDQLEVLMEGPAFIARQAAKRLSKSADPHEVVIHPVAIRYAFHGDLNAVLRPELDEFEQRLTWQPQRHLPLIERINRIGSALLALKEVEYFGEPRSGNPIDRAEQLVREMLAKLEDRWAVKDASGGVVARVKRLRTVIVAGMIGTQLAPDERERRWNDLAACYYVQQIAHYPRDYLHRSGNLPERVTETVERLVEDFTDVMPKFEPYHAVIDVGESITVSPQRDRSLPGDQIMPEVKRQLDTMIAALAAERTAV